MNKCETRMVVESKDILTLDVTKIPSTKFESRPIFEARPNLGPKVRLGQFGAKPVKWGQDTQGLRVYPNKIPPPLFTLK